VKNWRGTASSRTENSRGQVWKRLRFTKVCNARLRRKKVHACIRFTHAFVCMFKRNWVNSYADYNKGYDSPSLKLMYLKFKVCKSVHHRSFQINQPTRCNNFSSLLLDVYSMYSSTCFGRPHAHHQELNNCSSSLWFYIWSVVVAVLLVVVGPARMLNMLRASSRPSSGTQQLQ